MAITREKKEDILSEYLEQLKDSEAIIITGYRGMKVTDIQQLRARIREADGSYAVVKNTLARRALKENGWPDLDEMLTGPVGIGFCHHNVPGVAKAITEFAKKNEQISVRGGVMGVRVIDENAVKRLADLPSIKCYGRNCWG